MPAGTLPLGCAPFGCASVVWVVSALLGPRRALPTAGPGRRRTSGAARRGSSRRRRPPPGWRRRCAPNGGSSRRSGLSRGSCPLLSRSLLALLEQVALEHVELTLPQLVLARDPLVGV